MCRVLSVSTGGYYAWKKRRPSKRQLENEKLSNEVREIFFEKRKTYGSIRITDELKDRGKHFNKKRIIKLLISQGLYAKAARRFKAAKMPRTLHHGVTDLVQQEFSAPEVNMKVSSDITYLWTREGWMYLAVVLDMCSRKILGYALSTRLTGNIVIQALQRALAHRTLTDASIFHSDRGSQFGCDELKAILREHGIRQSMGATGVCYDNAITESFFHTLKVEAIHGERFESREQLEVAIFDYIECFYNTQRKHSALGYLSPDQFEQQLLSKNMA